MKLPLILALAALALSFALTGCAHSTPKNPSTTTPTSTDIRDADAGDPEEHRKVVVAHAEEFRTCYQPALHRRPGLMGVVTLRWTVNAAGDVENENAIESNTTIQDKLMIECMLDRVHNWKFNTGRKGEVSTVTYPFYFSPPKRD